jgi:hypothetical protein
MNQKIFFTLFSIRFRQAFNSFSRFFAKSCFSLAFFVFTLKFCAVVPKIQLKWIAAFQTESKGNFESMSLYRHITRFQPQPIRAKKQTFPNHSSLLPCEAGEGMGNIHSQSCRQ